MDAEAREVAIPAPEDGDCFGVRLGSALASGSSVGTAEVRRKKD